MLLNIPSGLRTYNHLDLITAFCWFTRSRALYKELRCFLKIPSLTTLAKITRRAKNTDDNILFQSFFENLDPRSRACILITDEVYVQASLAYSGGVLHGLAENHPDQAANTVLAIMIKCLFKGEKFLARIIPCHGLTAEYQHGLVKHLTESVQDCGGQVIALIVDNNRLNQAFFKLYVPLNKNFPWIVKNNEEPLFLLYDTVHLLKNLRNNWHTEKTQTLKFFSPADTTIETTAHWSDLKDLYSKETNTLTRLSKLTKNAVFPSNIQVRINCAF